MKKLSKSLLVETVVNRRKELKLTQQKVSDKTGINRSMLSHLESGTFVPSIEQLEKLAELLDFDITNLFIEK